MNAEITEWLLAGDPSIKWQTMNFLGYDTKDIEQTRSTMEGEGWAKKILDNQDSGGSWSQGMYVPKFTSTTYSLLLLKRLGLPNSNTHCQKGATLLFSGLQPDGGINFASGPKVQSETCITGMIFNLVNYFSLQDNRIETIFVYLKKNQMADGGWNCKYIKGDKHASFNTTMLVLEGLQSYRQKFVLSNKVVKDIEAMEEKGREFLLRHKLYKSHTTGEIVKKDYLRHPFPYHWKYDVLTALDYFQACKAPYDERLEDAIALLESKSEKGYIKNDIGQSGKNWLTMESVGKPSRYNTLRWQRILQWWYNSK